MCVDHDDHWTINSFKDKKKLLKKTNESMIVSFTGETILDEDGEEESKRLSISCLAETDTSKVGLKKVPRTEWEIFEHSDADIFDNQPETFEDYVVEHSPFVLKVQCPRGSPRRRTRRRA